MAVAQLSSNLQMQSICSTSPLEWAQENFGGARLHGSRRKQLVRVASLAARRPCGTITGTAKSDADRQSVYGFVENEAVAHTVLIDSLADATARRARQCPFVFVPIDGSSLSITDTERSKGTGRIGSPPGQATGLKVLDAIAVSPDGTPLGIAGMQLWSRTQPKRSRSHQSVPIEERESYRWLQMVRDVRARFETGARRRSAWFQLDREGDFAELWKLARDENVLVTARARLDRKLATGGRLSSRLRRQRPLGEYTLHLPAKDGREEQRAQIQLRACRIQLRTRERPARRYDVVELTAVQAREVGTVTGRPRIEWTLLTTRTVDSFEDATLVVDGYAYRWSIEEFHRTWKSGLCRVESMQLRSFGALAKWATILAAVAMRAAYLAQIAREKPDAPATDAFSEAEVETLITIRKPKGVAVGDPVTVSQAVRWVADLGGYVGNKRSGPPGKVTIGRGLYELEIAVLAITAYKSGLTRSKRD